MPVFVIVGMIAFGAISHAPIAMMIMSRSDRRLLLLVPAAPSAVAVLSSVITPSFASRCRTGPGHLPTGMVYDEILRPFT